LARTEQYAGKILFIRAGQRLSLQHHTSKDETLFLLDGHAELELDVGTGEPVRWNMTKNESYRVQPGRKHRLAAMADARVLEISTPELDDVVRWEDDYGRASFLSGVKAEHRSAPDAK
jgi:mannose-6-phosphate isomerase